MKPIYLSIENINSFSDKTEIDFKKVLDGGIFGIFGDTGSGKSTILDCITLALYGEMKRSKVQCDFVSNGKDGATVAFEFSVNEGKSEKRYDVRRTYKIRKSGNVTNAELFEIADNGKLALANGVKPVNDKIKEIIGLDFQDFQKCIVLPQGDFDEFLKASKKPRLDIIGRLFDLEKYGTALSQKIKDYKAKCREDLSTVIGELSAYDGYTKELLEEKIAESVLKKNQKEKLSISLKEAEIRFNEITKARELTLELETAQNALDKLNERAQKMAELKDITDKYPSFKDLFKALSELSDLEKKESKLKVDLKNSTEEEARLKGEQTFNTQKINSLDYENKTRILNDKITDIKGLKNSISSYDELKKSLLASRANYSSKQEELDKSDQEKKAKQKRLDALKNGKVIDCDKIINEFYQNTCAIQKNCDSAEIIDYINSFADNGKTLSNDFINEATNYFTKWQTESLGKDELIVNALKDLGSFNSEEKEEVDKLEKEISNLTDHIAALKAQMAIVIEKGKTDREQCDSLKGGIEKVIGNESFENALKKAANEKEKLDKEYNSLNTKKDSLSDELREIAVKIAQFKSNLDNLGAQIFEKNKNITDISLKCGIIDINEAKHKQIDSDTYDKYLDEVNKYYSDLSIANSKVSELQAKTNGKRVTEDEKVAAENYKNELKRDFDKLNADCAVIVDGIKKDEEKLKEKADCQLRKTKAQDKFDVCDKLESITKGDKLLEFVADEYLKEICYNASSRLMELSSGRYGLTYDGDFYVTDNYAAGRLRAISTLSGGETFIVSLSLAVSLSAAIFTKSSRPIEFFFLDEGFGTLDEQLIDTVCDCLEKLKGDHFLIGLISHVKELQQRINCKILVKHATINSGSKIEIAVD